MATITKIRARKPLVNDTMNAGISNFPKDNGLRFRIHIGNYIVSLLQVERDALIAQWEQQEKDFLK